MDVHANTIHHSCAGKKAADLGSNALHHVCMSEPYDDESLKTRFEIEVRARLHAHAFPVAFMMSQFVQRDAKARGVAALSLCEDLPSQLPGILVEARCPEPFKAEMLDELRAIAEQVVRNVATYDELGQPDF